MPCSTPMTLVRDLSYRLKLKIDKVSTTCSTSCRSTVGFEFFGESLLYPKHAATASTPWCCAILQSITAVRLQIRLAHMTLHKRIGHTHLVKLPLAVERCRDDLKAFHDFNLPIHLRWVRVVQGMHRHTY